MNKIILIILIIHSYSLPFLCENNNDPCKIEFGDYTQNISEQKRFITIAEYNIDRNARGGDSPLEKGLPNIISIFNQTNPTIPLIDVFLLSEVARDCQSYDSYSGAQLFAQSLNLTFIYTVEFLDEGQSDSQNQCTYGNAILSRYPIISFNQTRFEDQCCFYPHRLGGRVSANAIIDFHGQNISISSVHLESGTSAKDQIQSMYVRHQQIQQIVKYQNDLIQTQNISLAIIGGDFNSPLQLGSTIWPLKNAQFQDALSSIPWWKRGTSPQDDLAKFGLDTLDYIFAKSQQKQLQFVNATICNKELDEKCYGSSDHLPLWVTIEI